MPDDATEQEIENELREQFWEYIELWYEEEE